MWLMDERQKLQDLGLAMQSLANSLEKVVVMVQALEAQLQRRKEEQIVLEARVDRLEKGPATRARLPIPSVELSSPAASSAGSADSSSPG